MKITKTEIEGVIVIEPTIHRDKRGFFLETFSEKTYKNIGIQEDFIQDNFSHSKKNTLRGLHFQSKNPQGKLVKVSRGEVFDVAVDIRKDSSTFGKHFSIVLNDKNFKQLYMPPGIAHGFYVISENADFQYKCTDYYFPDDQCGIIWNDKTLNIDWPSKNPLVSEKDKLFCSFGDFKLSLDKNFN